MVLNDFGPHAYYDVNTDAPIIGLSGKNGSGKSNFLSAIEFGLRGKAGDSDETLASFIRSGASKASVTEHFRKDGNEGIITREIKPNSSTRTLTWMGKKITKDAEVKAALNEILGVDEYVLQNAVFIPQGQLDKLLFGTPTEREEMFIKMMLLGYMAKVSEVAEQKAQMLARTIQDVSVLKDELQRQQSEAEKQLVSVEYELSRCPDMREAIEQWNRVCAYSVAINMHAAEAAAANDTAHVAECNASTLLSDYSSRHNSYKVITKAEIENEIKDRKAALSSYRNSITAVSRGIELRKIIQSYKTDVVASKQALELAESALLAASGGLNDDVLQAAKDRLRSAEIVNASYVVLRSALKSEAEYKESIAKATSELERTTKAKDAVASELELIASDGRDIQVKLDTLKAVTSSARKTMSHCPLCEQDFRKSKEDLDSMLAETEAKHTYKKTQWQEVKTKLVALENELSEFCTLISTCRANLNIAANTVSEQHAVIAGMPEVDEADISASRADILQMEASLRRQQALQSAVVSAANAVANAEHKLNNISEEDKQQAQNSTEEILASLNENASHEETLLADAESCHNALAASEKTRADAVAVYDRHKASEADIRAKLAAESILPATQNIVDQITTEFSECEQDKDKLRALVSNELNKKQNEHEQTKGLLAGAKKHADDAVSRLRELEKKEEINAETNKIVEELRRIKDAFGRKGIPRSYINYYYDKLLRSAQSTLEAMEANFSIQPHPTKPVTLQFTRDNQTDSAVFDQSKLSGGQRVRVTMAFLLAVQKQLVPELGFLCLDEPSMHIDPEGQEAMRDMLSSLGAQMANGEAQIWISDHSEILATAYDKVIKLK